MPGACCFERADITARPPWARPVNMMFPVLRAFPHMGVAENVATGCAAPG